MPPAIPLDPDRLRREPGLIFQRTFNLLREKAWDLIRALTPSEHPEPGVPPRTPKELRQLTRAQRAEEWIYGLARALVGDPIYCLPRRDPKTDANPSPASPKPDPAPAPAGKSPRPRLATDTSRWLARLNRQRHVFATVPTATIAARLARRCDIKPESDFWPVQLLQIEEPPAVWGQRARAAAAPYIRAHERAHESAHESAHETPYAPPPPPTANPATPEPPEFHRRE